MRTAIQDFHVVASIAGETNTPVEISAVRLVELSNEIKALEALTAEVADLKEIAVTLNKGRNMAENDNIRLTAELKAANARADAAQAENARIKMDVKSLEIANRESMNMLIERDDEIKRLKSETYCAYCGERFELDNGSAALVSEHIHTCVKHPMRAVEVENARLREAADLRVDAMREELSKCKGARDGLSAQIDFLQSQYDKEIAEIKQNKFENEFIELRAEVERLRAALEWFTDPGNYPGTAVGEVYKLAEKSTAVAKARAALEPRP